jgi:hypothetical protein
MSCKLYKVGQSGLSRWLEIPSGDGPVYGRDCRDLSQQGKAGGWVPEVLTDRRR